MTEPKPRATYGARAVAGLTGQLPNPYPRLLGSNALRYLQEVVESGLTVDMLTRFEQAFAEATGAKHCIATPGCTPALAALAAAFGFEPGDEIIVSPITDYGTLQGLVREQYIPVFADPEPGSVNLSARTIEPLLTDRTRGILCVHMTGLMCDMDPILELAQSRGLVVYEDACQSVFSTYRGRYAGRLGLAGAFSFDSEKTMGSDVGGCVITDDDALAERLRFIAHSRGAVQEPGFGRFHTEPGYALRMPQCTAALCLAQLEMIAEWVAHRDRMARKITALLSEIEGITPLPIPDYQEVYSAWMLGFSLDPEAFSCDAEAFGAQVSEAGLTGAGTGKYYLIPAACTFLGEWAEAGRYPYSQPPASRTYRYGAEACPTAWEFLQTFIRWSTFCEKYTEADCELAAQIVADVAARNRR
jgi:dTDP-4-amino-4,6-dideoxygalactose transaminase